MAETAVKNIRRFAGAINYNYMLYAVVAVSLLYTLTSPPISDAVVNFLFGGIVPGTGIVIEPEVILLGESIIIVLAMLAGLLYLRFKRSSPIRRQAVLAGRHLVHKPQVSIRPSLPQSLRSGVEAVGALPEALGAGFFWLIEAYFVVCEQLFSCARRGGGQAYAAIRRFKKRAA